MFTVTIKSFIRILSFTMILSCLMIFFVSCETFSEDQLGDPSYCYDKLKKTVDKYEKNEDEKLLSQACALASCLHVMETEDGSDLDEKFYDLALLVKKKYFEDFYEKISMDEFYQHIKHDKFLDASITKEADGGENAISNSNMLYLGIIGECGKLVLNRDPEEFSREMPVFRERLAECYSDSILTDKTDNQREIMKDILVFWELATIDKIKLNDDALEFTSDGLHSIINKNNGLKPEKADSDEFYAVFMSYCAFLDIYNMQGDTETAGLMESKRDEFVNRYQTAHPGAVDITDAG